MNVGDVISEIAAHPTVGTSVMYLCKEIQLGLERAKSTMVGVDTSALDGLHGLVSRGHDVATAVLKGTGLEPVTEPDPSAPPPPVPVAENQVDSSGPNVQITGEP